jgi:hypothetical protein
VASSNSKDFTNDGAGSDAMTRPAVNAGTSAAVAAPKPAVRKRLLRDIPSPDICNCF